MQKVFDDCYAMDRRCYEEFGLTEDILMEHAADGMAQYIRALDGNKKEVLIVAGPGNNGADGITLARLLHSDFEVSLYMPYGAKSDMAKLQLQRLLKLGVKPVENTPLQTDIIVDALFGAGFSKPLNEKGVELIKTLNVMKAKKIACDIPTGIDPNGNPNPVAFKADITITMGSLKKALFADHSKPYIGEIEVVDLGVSRKIYEIDTSTYLLEADDFNPPLRDNPASHKGHYGHLAIICGEKSGAATLSGLAALRFGAGLVTLVGNSIQNIPYSLMQSKNLPTGTNAVAIGMGMGYDLNSDIADSIVKNDLAVLMDADICYIPSVKTLLDRCSKTVITPHPKEFAALLKTVGIADVSVEDIQRDRFGWAKRFCENFPKTVLLLKGANTIIAYNDKIYINPLGSQVLSQAGSGDVLSGLIASLMAQGYSPLDAAINGSLAHTMCARNYKGANFSAIAEDLIEELRWLIK
ncbi:NAD(P)H-hydrate dehydratase [Hydrogenimonas thermophila]|uniref:Bifunctional NAD(P)H-hydrate repair enzyme n=1 Tax=Hydrogenimonas thermophila TaxID=223786 RepID=A0A1I5T5C1_9BACT|nr:NAD(P)H-hydrate dehydratase [Hydrogenimonas thermophila]SFP78148.1 yjeF C-terminal region, hydroxyethylthiazole kinase-related/yjeF N-terminal region [Hydrogenimonas thermophila]